jgi:hypothetical protein
MRLRELWVMRGGIRVGVFTSLQSACAFGVGISIVTTITRASRTIGGIDGESNLISLVTSFAVVCVVVALTASDPETRPQTVAAWVVAILAAMLNTLFLYSAAIGIEKF